MHTFLFSSHTLPRYYHSRCGRLRIVADGSSEPTVVDHRRLRDDWHEYGMFYSPIFRGRGLAEVHPRDPTLPLHPPDDVET